MNMQSALLAPLGPDRTGGGTYLVVSLVHNEANLIGPFLDHYRTMGDVRFAIVDDRSTDGTRELLRDAPDVTLFAPRDGSSYARDKSAWRGELLDASGDGRWCLVPDIDEHLVWRGMDRRPLDDVVDGLEREGAEAAFCTMVDMYRDAPLADHVFDGGSLRDAFPLFDDPARDPLNTRMEAAPAGFARAWPTPRLHAIGGMRQRLFGGRRLATGGWRDRVAGLLPPMRDPSPTGARLLTEKLMRALTNDRRAERPLNLSKIALLRWKRGSCFFGGPHALRPAYRLGRERMCLLHYPITRGMDGVSYVAERGEHARGAVHYREIARSTRSADSPVYDGTSRYEGPQSLHAFFRDGDPT